MPEWRKRLSYDPIPFLLDGPDPLRYFVRRDLLREKTEPIETLWEHPGALRTLSKQKWDGRWEYPRSNERIREREDYDQIETYRQLGVLVEKFGFTHGHPSIKRACDFLFSHQTLEGDFRGIYGRQYSPNYSAAIMELLIKARLEDDRRVERGFDWLLSMRQEDGGWAIPTRTAPGTSSLNWTKTLLMDTVMPNRSKPSSHLVTGVVLRAFAAHKRYRKSKEAKRAAELLCNRLFTRDFYMDRMSQDFWWRVSFPFWFTDIVSALDSLSMLGCLEETEPIHRALRRLKDRQISDGSFRLKLLRTGDPDTCRWVTLAACRVFARFYHTHNA